MKKLFCLIAILAPFILLTSCQKDTHVYSSTGSWMIFVYGCTPHLSGTINMKEYGNNVTSLQGDGTSLISETGFVPCGNNLKLSWWRSGAKDTLLDSISATLVNDGTYSVFLGGPASSPCFLFAANDSTLPDSGFVHVRFVDLSSDNYNFNCYYDSLKVDSGITYKTITPYIQIPVSQLAGIRFTDRSDTTVTAELDSVSLVPVGHYTIVLGGNHGSADFGLTVKVIFENITIPFL